MTEHLRDGAVRSGWSRDTAKVRAPGGMRGAADRCMNIGACRK